ncbi:MAG: PsbP-related protein [bacterium]|nr:PsbP-related protein [bacterium]
MKTSQKAMPTGPLRRSFSEASRQGFISPLLLALVAILILGGGAYVYGQKKQASQPVVQTSDWKTYTNTQYGFSLQYPNDLTVREDSNIAKYWLLTVSIYDANYKAPEGVVGQQVRNEQRSVTINVLEKSDENLNSIKKIIALQEPSDKTNLWPEKTITVDGETVTFYKLFSGLVGTNYKSYLSNGKYIFDVTGFQSDLLEEILSTVKLSSPTVQTSNSQTANWKTFATTTTSSMISYDPTGIASPIVNFSFQYPSGWSICKKVDTTEYITVSDNCSSNGGKPFAYPRNYFLVRNIGALDWSDIPSGTLRYETNWKTYQYPPEPMRSISYPSKNIDLVLVGSDSDMQSILDRIASTFKINP